MASRIGDTQTSVAPSISGRMPGLITGPSAWSTNRNFAAISPPMASAAPRTPAITASIMNGSWVRHRDAPTSRMIWVSVRRV